MIDSINDDAPLEQVERARYIKEDYAQIIEKRDAVYRKVILKHGSKHVLVPEDLDQGHG